MKGCVEIISVSTCKRAIEGPHKPKNAPHTSLEDEKGKGFSGRDVASKGESKGVVSEGRRWRSSQSERENESKVAMEEGVSEEGGVRGRKGIGCKTARPGMLQAVR